MTESETHEGLLEHLPNESAIWIFGSARPLTTDQTKKLQSGLERFFREWKSHGRSVNGAYALLDAHFIVIAAHVPSGDISGCGIDSAVRELERLASESDVEWAPSLWIFLRKADGGVTAVSRSDFKSMAANGTVTSDTQVFDLTLTTLGELRNGGFEKVAASSWVRRTFSLESDAKSV